MKNLTFVIGGTALIVGGLATPASALSFLVEGNIEGAGSLDIFGLVDEGFDFDFDFNETIDPNDFGIADEVVVNALADGNITVPSELVNLFLPFDFAASLDIGEFDLIDYLGSLSVEGVGDFGVAFNANDPDNPSLDLTPVAGSDIDLSICLTSTCLLSGSFAADLGADVDLGFLDTSASVDVGGMFALSTTPLASEPPGDANPSEPDIPDVGAPNTPDPVSVPEPMTVLGTAIATAAAAIFTHRRSQ